jgi:2-polyprenyl-3-methyl-5-hydroxy-6-metoxy-1,4-benzoquinol methylase
MNDKVQGGFPPEAFDGLAAQEDSNWWFRSRNKIIIWAITKYASNPETFLEIGCGTGFVLQAIHKTFPFTTLHGDEYFEEGLQYAKIRVPDASFRKLDATKMEDRDCYDAIGAFDVVEHIEDDNTALKNCFQALKKDGHLFLTVPQHMWLWSQVDEDACHVRRYTQSELKFKVEQSGFHVLTSASFISFLVPLMFLSRKSLLKKTLASRSEFKIPGWLNLFFEIVMQVEIYFIKLGFRFPFGGSLILVAKKP